MKMPKTYTVKQVFGKSRKNPAFKKAYKQESEKLQLIRGYVNRIKHQKGQLAKTRKYHRGIEKNIQQRISASEMTLRALKK